MTKREKEFLLQVFNSLQEARLDMDIVINAMLDKIDEIAEENAQLKKQLNR